MPRAKAAQIPRSASQRIGALYVMVGEAIARQADSASLSPIAASMDAKQIYLSPDLAHRLAAIDIGSNSVRLMVAEPLREGNYRILDEEPRPTRLGRALNSTGRLDPAAIEQTLAALRRFKQIADGFQVDELRHHRHLRRSRSGQRPGILPPRQGRARASTSKSSAPSRKPGWRSIASSGPSTWRARTWSWPTSAAAARK